MQRRVRACFQAGLLAWLMVAMAWEGRAQIDPDKRRLLELGYNLPTQGQGPIAAYAFFYYNEPQFIRTNLTLRLVVAPVYLDSQLGIHDVLPNTDLAFGLAGGGFADSYSEIRQGHLYHEESFTGHAAELNTSIYHRFNPDDRIPLTGVLRVAGHLSAYERDSKTSYNFTVPDDQATFRLRTGLRWGGREPVMTMEPALELSAWYEGVFRGDPSAYGINGDRNIEAASHLFWTRALFSYRLPESQHSFEVSLTAGASIRTDRLSAYRLGGELPLSAEYPLDLPGYYFQELAANRFLLLHGMYELPLNHAKTFGLATYGGTALVDYTRGLEQPGKWNSGVGAGVTFAPSSRPFKVLLGYAYGIDAIRDNNRGAHNVSLLMQYDFAAPGGGLPSFLNPNKWRGMDWLLHR